MIDAYPNSRNVIPGRTFITADFRHPDDNVLSQMDRALRDSVADTVDTGNENHRCRRGLGNKTGIMSGTCNDLPR